MRTYNRNTSNNIEIRAALNKHRFTMWQLADALDVGENTVYRWLRHELDAKKKAEVMKAISRMVKNAERIDA
jgi:hypothetical protein